MQETSAQRASSIQQVVQSMASEAPGVKEAALKALASIRH
jgi:hypothetical protein